MKRVTILLFMTICTLLDAQPPINSKTSIKLYFSPDICYRSLGNGISYRDLRNETEIVRYGNTMGIGISNKLNTFLDLEVGVQYATRGYQTKQIELNSFEPDPVIPDMVRNTYQNKYFGIPVSLSLIKSFNRLSLKPTLGIVTNFLLISESEVISYYEDGSEFSATEKFKDSNELCLTSVIGIGISYRIFEFFDFQIEPTFQHDFLRYHETMLSTYFWNLGLRISLYYRI